MAKPKYTLYKYVKLSRGKWRYYRAARYKNHLRTDPDCRNTRKYA